MPLILNRDSSCGATDDKDLGAISAFLFDSSEVEGAETTVQVALVGYWLLAEGGHTVEPGFWMFTGSDCELVAQWCEAIREGDYGHFGLMALADFLWTQETEETKAAFAEPIPGVFGGLQEARS